MVYNRTIRPGFAGSPRCPGRNRLPDGMIPQGRLFSSSGIVRPHSISAPREGLVLNPLWRKWQPLATTHRPRKLRLESLESKLAPTVSLGPISLTAGPVNEGQTVTVSGTYTAIETVGSAQLVIDWADGSNAQVISVAQGVDVPFSVNHAFFDDNPTGTPSDNVTISVRLEDTGPRTLTAQDGGKYRAFDVPGLHINLADSLNALGAKSGVKSAGLDNDDENSVVVPLTGTFRFYGQDFTGVNVSENGVLSFNGQIKSGANTSLSSTGKVAIIAPFWDDLRTNTGLADRVLYRSVNLDGEAGDDYFIIEWSNVPHVGNDPTKTATFQVLLQLNTGGNNSDIIFNYIDTDFGNPSFDFGASATIGIQSGGTPQTGFTNLAAFKPDICKNGQAVRFSVQNLNITQLAGPEGFGYQAFSMPFESNLNLITAPVPPAATNGNVRLIGGAGAFDDVSSNAAAVLGATDTFNFYGSIYNITSAMNVSDNGIMVFGGVNNSGVNTDLTTIPTQPTIAALWDQWSGAAGVSNVFGRVIDLDGDTLGEFLCIEWSDMQNAGSPTDGATWQLLLELNTDPLDAGDIYVNYRDTTVGNANFNAGASATVGIKDLGAQGGANARRMVVPRGTNGINFTDGHAIGMFQSFTPPQTATIKVFNLIPVIDPQPDAFISEGDNLTRTITFTDASSTLLGFGDSFGYTIDFGDGTPLEQGPVNKGGRSFQFSHTYADDGTSQAPMGKYKVTLNLVDDDTGKAAQTSFVVNVASKDPTLNLTFTDNKLIQPQSQLKIFPIASFTDPGFTYGPAGTSELFEYDIDWGDGTMHSTAKNIPVTQGSPGVVTTGQFNGLHTYLTPGVFTVTVKVIDDDGGTDSKSFVVGVGSRHLSVQGADQGGGPLVVAVDATLGIPLPAFYAYDPAFRGGVRVASADITGDTLADIVTAAGPGGGPHIKVFDGYTRDVIRSFFAFDASFSGGVYVATGDVNGDGTPDIIAAAGGKGGPHVKVFSGVDNKVVREFFAYDARFTGGVRVASADLDGDGFADIITGPGAGGGPHVRAFSGQTGKVLNEFFAYPVTFTGGVNVAAGDINGDSVPEIITGPGMGGGPLLRIWEGLVPHQLTQFNAYPPGVPGTPPPFTGDTLWSSGLYVGVTDIDGDGELDIIVGPGSGRPAKVRIFDGTTQAQIIEYTVFDPTFLGGVFVSGN